MQPAELFADHASLVERIASGVCRREHLDGADAEDFVADVRLALLDDDYAILRQFEGRSSLRSFLSVVIERLFFDQRTRALGRWFPSSHAERLGAPAVLLEKLLKRDRRPFEQALPFVLHAYPHLTRDEVARLADELPERLPRPQPVPLDEAGEEQVAAPERADQRALARETGRVADQAGAVLRGVMASLPLEDRMLVRFRFGKSSTIAEISRMMRLPQRQLYRRIESLLQRFRAALEASGIDGRRASNLLAASSMELDFGLAMENGAADQSLEKGTA